MEKWHQMPVLPQHPEDMLPARDEKAALERQSGRNGCPACRVAMQMHGNSSRQGPGMRQGLV